MTIFLYQLKRAVLSLKQQPGFVLSVVVTMGVTLGALLCVININYLLLIEPLSYPDPDRIYVADHKIIDSQQQTKTIAFSYAGLVHLYKNQQVFEQTAMVIHNRERVLLKQKESMLNTAYVTPEFHQILDSAMAVGRYFEESEALDSNNPVAVLSYHTWQQVYAGDANVLSEKINISDVSYRIIGVLGQNFVEPQLAEIGRHSHIWLPWDFNKAGQQQKHSFTNINGDLKFIGKLKSAVSQSQAEKQITPLVNERWQRGVAEYDFFKNWSVVVKVRSLYKATIGDSRQIANMLLVAALGLVLIACTNISNLFMSRCVEKRRNMAFEVAIGATSRDIFKAMLAETSLLMLIASVVALMFAQGGFYFIEEYFLTVLPRVRELSLNSMIICCTLLLTTLLTLVFAQFCARLINYNTLHTSLKTSGKGSGLQVAKTTRQLLIAAQVAIATTLIFTNLSLFTQAVNTIKAPMGFTTDDISTLTLSYTSAEMPSLKEQKVIMTEFMKNLGGLPQIDAVAQGSSPLDGFGIKLLTTITDHKRYTPYFKRIDHRYFNMITQKLLSGENFTQVDRQFHQHLMIVNRAFAVQLKADADVIGMELVSIGEPNFRIIGIVDDITIQGDKAFGGNHNTVNVPRAYAPNDVNAASFMIKIKPDQGISTEQINQMLTDIDPRYSVFSLTTLADLHSKILFAQITTATTTVILASITFLLALLGLYGVVSYSTQMRQFEIGTRLAIGAKRKDIVWLVLQENMVALVAGLCIGVLCLITLYSSFGKHLTDYFSLSMAILSPLLITLVLISSLSFLSCYLPLRQYINKPPIDSLRGSN